MFADFRPTSEVAELEKTLTSTLMKIAKKKDIADYVLRALYLTQSDDLALYRQSRASVRGKNGCGLSLDICVGWRTPMCTYLSMLAGDG